MKSIRHAALAAALSLGVVFAAGAQDLDKIRRNLQERLPNLDRPAVITQPAA